MRQNDQAGPAGTTDFFILKLPMRNATSSIVVYAFKSRWIPQRWPNSTCPRGSRIGSLHPAPEPADVHEDRCQAALWCGSQKAADNLPAIIKIYQWPMVSKLRLFLSFTELINTVSVKKTFCFPGEGSTKMKMHFTSNFWLADAKLVKAQFAIRWVEMQLIHSKSSEVRSLCLQAGF